MNDAKHTKGPWEVQKLNHAEGELWLQIGCQRDGHSWEPIAELKYLVASDEQQWADARLIAAAPDGYELAKHILAMRHDVHFSGHPEWQEIVSEAAEFIFKAEGK